jgi:hypothetical protein
VKSPVVFISYATPDQTIAGMVCQALEQEHISCWIAPRNVPVGEKAFEAIPRGVAGCTVLILILSERSMQSEYVQRELQLGLHHKKVIIPFRIEDVELDGAVNFMLTGVQWLDAFVPPLERHVAALVKRVAGILGSEQDNASEAQPVAFAARKKKPSHIPWMAVAGGALVLVLVVVAGYFGFFRVSDAGIHDAVVQRLQPVLNPHGVLIDCLTCAPAQPHVEVQVSGGHVVLSGVVVPDDEALVRAVPLDVRGLRSVSYTLRDLAPEAAAPAAATESPRTTPTARAAPVAAQRPSTTTPASAPPAAAPALTAEELRARAAVLTGQQKMREQDYVAAQNYFRLALNLDPDNQSARAGLKSASKALGEN